MSDRPIPSSKSLNTYLKVKKLQIFAVLKRLNFNGQLTWRDSQNHQWVLFFNQGQVIYGTGGHHPIRRWYRHMQAQLPQQDLSFSTLQQACAALPEPILPGCWDYQLLYSWFRQGQISQATLQEICSQILADLLFEVMQADQVHYQLTRQPPLPSQVVPITIDETRLLTQVTRLWEDWSGSEISAYSPNLAPIIKHPEPIQAEVSTRVFQSLMQLLDGQRSLRDLAVKLGQDVMNLTQALQPYIQAGWIALEPLADFPPLFLAEGGTPLASGEGPPLIACIDDSVLICKSMGQVIRSAGYDFLAITEGTRAVPMVLAKKPDLVFLDLIMPGINGYEICSQLRKISRFKDTPIVILSGNDGLVDQVRARLLGASDFLSKPIEPIVILSVIRKHLGQPAYAKA